MSAQRGSFGGVFNECKGKGARYLPNGALSKGVLIDCRAEGYLPTGFGGGLNEITGKPPINFQSNHAEAKTHREPKASIYVPRFRRREVPVPMPKCPVRRRWPFTQIPVETQSISRGISIKSGSKHHQIQSNPIKTPDPHISPNPGVTNPQRPMGGGGATYTQRQRPTPGKSTRHWEGGSPAPNA